MFHGMIQKVKASVFRMATAMPLEESDKPQEVFKMGTYTYAFLDKFFPDSWRVEVRKVIPRNTYDAEALTENNLDKNVVIRWSNASHQYNVIIDGNNGWLDAFTKAGFIVGNSKKFIKRAQEFVRQTSAFIYADDLNIQIMDPEEIGVDEKAVDGISAISRTMAMQMFLNNPNASIDWMQDKVSQIDDGKMVVVQIRFLTPNGLIKGNAIIVPDDQMHGFDIRTFTPNVKPEIKTKGFYWGTIEPSYGRLPLKSDDLTMSIYSNVVGLVDPALLLATIQNAVTDLVNKTMVGVRDGSDWLQTVIDNTGATEHLDDDIKDRPSMIKSIDQIAKRLDEVGLSIHVSQLLMYLKANGFGRMFGVVDKSNKVVRVGNVYKASDNGTWFPVPYAYRAHIMTRDALEIFGYKLPKDRGQGFYHHKTHCFVVPTEFFIENYPNHGGYDLDDTINVMIRRFVSADGKSVTKAFLVRNPNDFGEWSAIPVSESETRNAFHVYGAMPTVMEDDLVKQVPQLTTLTKLKAISYKYQELPGVAALQVSGQFSINDEVRVRTAMSALPGGTGATVIPKMLTYAITGTYIKHQLVSNEQIIDAVQQGLADESDMELIHQSNDTYYRRIKAWLVANKGMIDYYWADTRINVRVAQKYKLWEPNFSHVAKKEDSMMMELMLTRETIVRRAFAELLEWANTQMVLPAAVASIEFTKEEAQKTPTEFNSIIQLMNSTNPHSLWAAKLVNMLKKSDELFGQEVTDRKVLRLYRQSFVAKKAVPKANWDKWLFAVDPKLDQLPIDWFIRAYTRLVAGN